MSCRHGYLLPALVLGLLAPAGCMRWQSAAPQMVVAEHPAIPPARGGELTPAQAAQLCLTAGEALEKKGFMAEALRQYENARQHDPHAPAVARHLAVVYDLQGDAARAEREYLRALQEQPSDAELLNDFGYFHYRHNHFQAAENWLRNAITANPKCACAWTNLGQVLAYQGRAEESYQAFAHVLRPAEAYSNLGILLAKQGRTAEARDALQKAVKLDPGLKQPRAFLKALPDMPGPLPAGLTRNAPSTSPATVKSEAPVPPLASNRLLTVKPVPPANPPSPRREKAFPSLTCNVVSTPTTKVKPVASIPSNVSNRVGMFGPARPANPRSPQMEWMPPNRRSALPATLPSPTVPCGPMPFSAGVQELPMIVNGPIQPRPISTRPMPGSTAEQSSSSKMSRNTLPWHASLASSGSAVPAASRSSSDRRHGRGLRSSAPVPPWYSRSSRSAAAVAADFAVEFLDTGTDAADL